MLHSTLAQIACPGHTRNCGAPLGLRIEHSAPLAGNPVMEDVVSGILRCEGCGQIYPVVAGIAVLLPQWPEYLLARHGSLADLPQQALPQAAADLLNDPDLRHRRATEGNSWEADEVLNAYLLSHFLHHALDEVSGLGDVFSSRRIAEQVQRDWPETPLFLLKSWLAEAQPGGAFLEFGCSVGGLAALLSGLHAGPYLGLDLSIRAVAIARRLVLGADNAARGLLPAQVAELSREELRTGLPSGFSEHPVDFILGDAWRPPLAAQGWDVLAALNLVDFSPDPLDFLQMQAKLLRPGGHCFISAPLSPHSLASQALVGHATTPESTPTDALIAAYQRVGLDLAQRWDDQLWIVPRGPRYVEYFSVDALLLEKSDDCGGTAP